MGEMMSVLQSKEVSGGVFAAAIVFSVCSLELFRLWLERAPGRRSHRTGLITAATLAFAFLAMAGSGVAAYAAFGRLIVLGLGLLLTGVASLGVLIDLMVRPRGAGDKEMRRLAAHDL